MFEQELNEIYVEIAQQANDMMPNNWNSFYLNGEVKDGEGGVFFFFNTNDNLDEFIYSHYIPEIYKMDKKMYNQENHRLFKLINKLQQKFIENGQEAWGSLVMIVNEDRKLKIHFDYTKWSESRFGPSQRIDFFEYKYLSREPKNEKEKEIFVNMENYAGAKSE
ncbi:immunity protein YezG family protein [Listeria booriae]|uniref:immunity protein YezG family protein n=1 Tax=Listeria booriae TaxID=1552123 RepID=UPI001628E628|nr:immunity protein YezG family protein [Listeria booriae]MBC2366981.1 DUF600 family protein [Listeria booriae]